MISYKPFYRTLKKKGITQYLLKHMGVSSEVFTSLKHNRSISMHTVNKLCHLLDCDIKDIVKIIKTDEEMEILKYDFKPTHRFDIHKKDLKSDVFIKGTLTNKKRKL